MKGRMDERMDGRTMRSGAVWGMAAPWACRLGIVWWLSENCLGLFEICLDVIMEMEMETEMEMEMVMVMVMDVKMAMETEMVVEMEMEMVMEMEWRWR